ncbi:MAG TPA: hypothetical protein VFU16_11455 [Solirubrobacterales bacterium]|nr:hypothetical protein [Solirubrobacterales bacterium]
MKLTKIAIALVAVLAMSALTASAASANYQSSAATVDLEGNQNGKHAFKVDGQAVECNVAKFTRNGLETPANEVSKVVASYSNCTAFGFAGASVTMGSCTYNFDATTAGPMANVDFACTNNANDNEGENTGDARIFSTVFGSECEVHVDSVEREDPVNKVKGINTNLSTLNFSNNEPGGGDVRVGAAVTGIVAEKTKDNGLCPLSGTGVTVNATYNGNTDVTGDGAKTISVN